MAVLEGNEEFITPKADVEFERYGEYFLFFFLSEDSYLFINFSTLLFKVSSRLILGSLNDWLPLEVLDSFDLRVEKFREPRWIGLVLGGF